MPVLMGKYHHRPLRRRRQRNNDNDAVSVVESGGVFVCERVARWFDCASHSYFSESLSIFHLLSFTDMLRQDDN